MADLMNPAPKPPFNPLEALMGPVKAEIDASKAENTKRHAEIVTKLDMIIALLTEGE